MDAGNATGRFQMEVMMDIEPANEPDVHDGMCIGAEIAIRKELMDLNTMLLADGREVISVTVGGAPNFEVNIIHVER